MSKYIVILCYLTYNSTSYNYPLVALLQAGNFKISDYLLYCFWATPSNAQGFLLALCLGISPDNAWRIICSTRDQTRIYCMQSKEGYLSGHNQDLYRWHSTNDKIIISGLKAQYNSYCALGIFYTVAFKGLSFLGAYFPKICYLFLILLNWGYWSFDSTSCYHQDLLICLISRHCLC